ncbi:TPA: bifunctional NADH-specific enoyl-ACP reductase/trans-2-enoyl-CoA reductase, partial [Vibrio fluvialis]
NFDGGAYATVCKALVTKASVFIPGLSPYLLALYRVMKEKGTHEGCIEQMHRLFSDKLYGKTPVPVDGERLVRMDDWELNPDTQERVRQLLSDMNGDNFKQVGDYAGFKAEFLRLNGFDFDNVDYDADIDLERYK